MEPKAQIINIYVCYQLTNEFRNRSLVGFASSPDAAQHMVHNKGWYSGDGEYVERKAIKMIHESKEEIYLIDSGHDCPLALDVNLNKYEDSLRKTALDKLSDAEKKVLGL